MLISFPPRSEIVFRESRVHTVFSSVAGLAAIEFSIDMEVSK